MNQRKTNNSPWYSLGLAVLLCVAFLVVATGTTLARYRAEREKGITFAVREPEQICMGTTRAISAEEGTEVLPAGKEVFDPDGVPQWETVEGVTQLSLAVANGISETEFSEKDQKIRLRLIGTLGLWTETETASIYLLSEDGSGTKIKATVTPITKGTALYNTHGEGWIYTFQDAEGEELSWTLAGGELSYISMTVIIEDASLTGDVMLQPQVIGEVISE